MNTNDLLIIDLRDLSPRTYQSVIEAALVRAGLTEAAEQLHAAHPRDLSEMWRYIPDNAPIRLEVTP